MVMIGRWKRFRQHFETNGGFLFQTRQLVGVETMTAELEGAKEASGHDKSLFLTHDNGGH